MQTRVMSGVRRTRTQPAKAPLQLKTTVAQSATVSGFESERNSFAASARCTPMMSPSCAASKIVRAMPLKPKGAG